MKAQDNEEHADGNKNEEGEIHKIDEASGNKQDGEGTQDAEEVVDENKSEESFKIELDEGGGDKEIKLENINDSGEGLTGIHKIDGHKKQKNERNVSFSEV